MESRGWIWRIFLGSGVSSVMNSSKVLALLAKSNLWHISMRISWEKGVVPSMIGACIICIMDLASMVKNISPTRATIALCYGLCRTDIFWSIMGSYGFWEICRKVNLYPRVLYHPFPRGIGPPTNNKCQRDQIMILSHLSCSLYMNVQCGPNPVVGAPLIEQLMFFLLWWHVYLLEIWSTDYIWICRWTAIRKGMKRGGNT